MIGKTGTLLASVILIGCTLVTSGCSSDEPVIVGGPTPEILEWQARNRAEFEASMEEEHGDS